MRQIARITHSFLSRCPFSFVVVLHLTYQKGTKSVCLEFVLEPFLSSCARVRADSNPGFRVCLLRLPLSRRHRNAHCPSLDTSATALEWPSEEQRSPQFRSKVPGSPCTPIESAHLRFAV